TLGPEPWAHLDQVLQDQVLTQLGGLQRALVSGSDLMRSLGEPLLNQAAVVLGDHLPITDVAQAILDRGEVKKEKGRKAQEPDPGISCLLPPTFCRESAAPLVRSDPQVPRPKEPEGEPEPATIDFLLTPASDAGKVYGEAAKRAVPSLHLVTVPGQADLMYCREQGFLSVEDVQRLLRPCRAAYEEAAVTPPASPHARCDISDWVPLDP